MPLLHNHPSCTPTRVLAYGRSVFRPCCPSQAQGQGYSPMFWVMEALSHQEEPSTALPGLKGVSQTVPTPLPPLRSPFPPRGMARAGTRDAQLRQQLMINSAPRVPSAILIEAGGRLQPLAPWPPRGDPLVLEPPGRAFPCWAATVQHGAGVGAVSPWPVSPVLVALVPQGPVLGLRHSEGGGEMKAASPLPYFCMMLW